MIFMQKGVIFESWIDQKLLIWDQNCGRRNVLKIDAHTPTFSYNNNHNATITQKMTWIYIILESVSLLGNYVLEFSNKQTVMLVWSPKDIDKTETIIGKLRRRADQL